jgi:regulator of replication initiation timing
LEQIIAEERTKVIQREIGNKELKATNESLTEHLSSQNRRVSEHNESMGKLLAEIKALQEENEQLRGELKRQKVEQKSVPDPVTVERDYDAADELSMFSPGELPLTSTVGTATASSPGLKTLETSFERRLYSEMEKTQKNLRAYQQRLATRMRASDPLPDGKQQNNKSAGQSVVYSEDDEVLAAERIFKTLQDNNAKIIRELNTFSPADKTEARDKLPEANDLRKPKSPRSPKKSPAGEKPKSPKRKVNRQDPLQKQQSETATKLKSATTTTTQAATMTSSSSDKFSSSDLSSDEDVRKRQLEEENFRLLSIVREVTEELQHAAQDSSDGLRE